MISFLKTSLFRKAQNVEINVLMGKDRGKEKQACGLMMTEFSPSTYEAWLPCPALEAWREAGASNQF